MCVISRVVCFYIRYFCHHKFSSFFLSSPTCLSKLWKVRKICQNSDQFFTFFLGSLVPVWTLLCHREGGVGQRKVNRVLGTSTRAGLACVLTPLRMRGVTDSI